jgi:hypothetical protein
VLAADADFEVGVGCAPALHGHLDQLADAFLVEDAERIGLEDLLVFIVLRELRVVVAARTIVVRVRSFVPKLKTSASFAISSANSAARGISMSCPACTSVSVRCQSEPVSPQRIVRVACNSRRDSELVFDGPEATLIRLRWTSPIGAGALAQYAAEPEFERSNEVTAAKRPPAMSVAADRIGFLERSSLRQKGPPSLRCPGAPPKIEIQEFGFHCVAEAMRSTGPWPLSGSRDEPGSNWIEFDVAQSLPEVRDIKWARVVAGLPDVPAPRLLRVEISGVATVGVAEGQGHGVIPPGDADDVHVIGHEAVPEDVEVVCYGLLVQQLQIDAAVLVGEEDVAACVPALGDVMRDADGDNARETRHVI